MGGERRLEAMVCSLGPVAACWGGVRRVRRHGNSVALTEPDHANSVAVGGPDTSVHVEANQVIADGQGTSITRTTLKAAYPPKSGHWYVVVHSGADMQGSNAKYLLCGNLFS